MNLRHTVKQGEVGKIMEFTLTDADGAVDLTPYTVTVTLKKGSTKTLNAGAIVKRNQTTNPGECYYVWTTATATMARGDHKGNLELVAGSIVYYWPTDANDTRTYFTVEVQTPIA
jgi:hypothetical protein